MTALAVLLAAVSACSENREVVEGHGMEALMEAARMVNSDSGRTSSEATTQFAESSTYRPVYEQIPERLKILYIGNSYLAYKPKTSVSSSKLSTYQHLNSLIERAGVRHLSTGRIAGIYQLHEIERGLV